MSDEDKLVPWGWAAHRTGSYIGNCFTKHRLTHERFKMFWKFQAGKCAGCLGELAHPLEKQVLFGLKPEIDHCHQKGNVRGLLCRRCNDFLGKVNDNRAILNRLLEYLERDGRIE